MWLTRPQSDVTGLEFTLWFCVGLFFSKSSVIGKICMTSFWFEQFYRGTKSVNLKRKKVLIGFELIPTKLLRGTEKQLWHFQTWSNVVRVAVSLQRKENAHIKAFIKISVVLFCWNWCDGAHRFTLANQHPKPKIHLDYNPVKHQSGEGKKVCSASFFNRNI